jgi:LacI family transcriptional regulator
VALIAPDVASRAEVVVRCRNIDGGVAITSHLIDLGHERIAFVGGPEGSRDTIERLQGVKQELLRRGLKLPSSSVWFGINYYSEMGAEYAKRFSKKDPAKRPTAVVFANDAMALGFSKAVLTHGLRIPEDVSIAGFDDSPEAALVWPGLTTVAQPSRRMAAGACHALLKRIDRDVPGRAESFTYDVELVVRESCAPPSGSRPSKSR